MLQKDKILGNSIIDIVHCLLLTICVFVINGIVPSYVNGFPKNGLNFDLYNLVSNDTSREVFLTRYNSPVFRSRPFVLEFQNILHEYYGIEYQFSFNIINIVFVFLFFYCLTKVDFYRYIGTIQRKFLRYLFFLSMPIIFCFFGTICTYDDFLQYVFILLFIHYLFIDKHLVSVVLLTIACLVRETSFIYYFIVLSYYCIERANVRIRTIIYYVIPIVMYVSFLKYYLPDSKGVQAQEYLMLERFNHWRINFKNWNVTRESLVLLFIMIVPYVCILKWNYSNEKMIKLRRWYIYLIFFILINAVIVSTTALIREVRLLFLPLLIVIPFIHLEVKKTLFKLGAQLRFKNLTRFNFSALIIAFLFAFIFYKPSTVGTGYIFKVYVFLSFVIIFHLIRERINLKVSKTV